MSNLNNDFIPLQRLDLGMHRHLSQNDIKLLVQRDAVHFNLLECFEHLLFLAKNASFLEVTKEDGEEEIEHDYVAREYEQNEVDGGELALRASHTLVHYFIPAFAEENLEDGQDGPPELVEVGSGRLTIWIRFILIIQLYFASKELHAQQSKNVNEEHQENHIIPYSCQGESYRIDQYSKTSDLKQLKNLEQSEASERREHTLAFEFDFNDGDDHNHEIKLVELLHKVAAYA